MSEQVPSKERLAELIEDRQRFVTFLEVGDGDPDLADALNMARDMVAALKQLQSAHEPQPAASKKMVDGVLGCADHGCVFGHPGGMGTNGGCHCLSDVRPPALRRRVVKNVQLLRAEIERLQRDVYLLRNERDNLVDNVHRLTHEPPAECSRCRGSGEVRAMTQEHGPDDYEFDAECPECKGVGVVSRAAQPPEVKCEWGYDAGDDVWHTGCGQMHVFNIDGPTGNDYKWCPYCRKPIDDLSQSSPTKEVTQ